MRARSHGNWERFTLRVVVFVNFRGASSAVIGGPWSDFERRGICVLRVLGLLQYNEESGFVICSHDLSGFCRTAVDWSWSRRVSGFPHNNFKMVC